MAKTPENKEVHQPEPNNYVTISRRHGWLYGAGLLVILLVFFAAGAAIANHNRWDRNVGFVRQTNDMPFGHQGGFMMRGGFGGNVTINGQTRDEGVVTAVSGSSFTIAGHGSTTNVTTNSSTQYQGGNSVKQNDTVVVIGTTSGSTLTATEVVINP